MAKTVKKDSPVPVPVPDPIVQGITDKLYPPITDVPVDRTLQITVKPDVAVLIAKLITHWTVQGKRPSACTKSAVVDAAVRALAAVEGIVP